MDFTFEFVRLFLTAIYLVMPLLLFLSLWVIILGQLAGYIEGWNKFDSLYWAFITALTIGYGDIRPLKKKSKALSIIVGLTGIMLTGIVVSIAVHTATMAFEKYVNMDIILQTNKVIK